MNYMGGRGISMYLSIRGSSMVEDRVGYQKNLGLKGLTGGSLNCQVEESSLDRGGATGGIRGF